MHEAIRLFAKIALGVLIAIGLVGLYFSDNIRGYYRFREVCQKQAGLHVFSTLQKDVGWWTNAGDISGAITAAISERVAFVRYKDRRDGLLYDVYFRGGNRGNSDSYGRSPADSSKELRYGWIFVNERIPDETRLSRTGYDITDLRTHQLAAHFYHFGYSKFNQDRTLLAAPSGEACGDRILWTPPNEAKLFQQ